METTNAFALVKELGKFDISLKICGFTLMIDVIGLLPLSDGFRESKLLSSAVILAPGNCCFSFSTFFSVLSAEEVVTKKLALPLDKAWENKY